MSAYFESLRSQRHLSPHTVSNYGRDLAELTTMLAAAETSTAADSNSILVPRFATVTQAQIRRCASQLHARGLSARSIARKLSAWRGFFDWLAESTDLPANPVDGVKAPKRRKPLPKALSADDAVRLVSNKPVPTVRRASATQSMLALDRAAAACNYAMFELLYSSGLRVSELVGLDVRYAQDHAGASAGWIDFAAHEVIVTGKGGKMRMVPVGKAAIEALKKWIAIRETIVGLDTQALFVSGRGGRMSARLVQTRLKAHAQALGIPVDVHPHVLRHSFASHVLQSSGDLRAVQEMLGHASITSTQIYTSLDFQRLAQVYDAAHPRARRKT
ncbi:MAG: tyrosine recombinase XerC [Pseudomonadota bacterium]